MRPFLFFITKFLFLLIIVCVFSGFISNKYLVRKMTKLAENSDIIFFGDSRIIQGISESVLKHHALSYSCFGYGGASVYDQILISNLLENFKGVIIFEISNDIFHSYAKEFLVNYDNFIVPAFSYPGLVHLFPTASFIRFHNPFIKNFPSKLISEKDILNKSTKDSIKRVQFAQNYYEGRIELEVKTILINHLLMLQKNNPKAKIILLRTPFQMKKYPKIVNFCEPDFIKLTTSIKKNHFTFFDYGHMDAGVNKYRDWGHLNDFGGRWFTNLLITDLKIKK
jgi:hypothetical protein